MILEAILFLAMILLPAAIAGGGSSSDSSSESYSSNYSTYTDESWEYIRVYPSIRKAVRYHDGEREEEYYY